MIAALAESSNPQTCWRVKKKQLKDEESESVTNCNGLKLKAQDGKYRMTDVIGESVVTKDNKLNYEYKEEKTDKRLLKLYKIFYKILDIV